MSSNLSTEAIGPASSSGNVGTGTVGELKTDFANLLINRVTLGECLNVIRDACVARAADLVDEADEPTLENIRKDVAAFHEASSAGTSGASGTSGVSGSSVGDGSDYRSPDATGPSDSSVGDGSDYRSPDATGPSDSSGPAPDVTGPAEDGGNVGGPTGP